MQEILGITLSGMHQDMTRLEQVSVNLANAMTPGYKRTVPVAGATFAQHVDAASSLVSISAPSSMSVHRDTRPATLRSTSQALDVALDGPGHFEVMTPNGVGYTRQGNFSIDASGRLITAMGHAVMGIGGEIVLQGPNPRIDQDGRIFETGLHGAAQPPVAQLKVVTSDDEAKMTNVGNGILIAPPDAQFGLIKDGRVRQGYLENSNVNSMQEMVQLMQTMRHFESLQKVAIGYDDMLGGAVRKLGELS